jgi:hypothetical protein
MLSVSVGALRIVPARFVATMVAAGVAGTARHHLTYHVMPPGSVCVNGTVLARFVAPMVVAGIAHRLLIINVHVKVTTCVWGAAAILGLAQVLVVRKLGILGIPRAQVMAIRVKNWDARRMFRL